MSRTRTMAAAMDYRLTTLPNGLRVISEHVPGVRSVAVGCWVDTGTRDEADNEAGAAHFLEHLLFKGSERLRARDISERFDAMGADSNAFTTKEHTCFWAHLLDSDLPEGLGIVAEMVQRPAFRPADIDSERDVVVEEINMADDDPGDVAFEEFTRALFAGHPLEAPVLGTRESIRAMSRDDLAGYWKRRYAAGSAVLALAGSVDHDAVVGLASDLFGEWAGDPVDHETAPVPATPRVRRVRRRTEQAHLVLGGLGLRRGDPRRWTFDVLNQILGGGMSSRLFTSIREERGLAYSVYSFRNSFVETGAWGVYAGTAPKNAHLVLDLVAEELDRMGSEPVTDAELDRAKRGIRGSIALAMEDTNTRMVRLGRDELVGVPHLSVDEAIAEIDAVTAEGVRRLAAELFAAPRVLGAVGPFSPADLERHVA